MTPHPYWARPHPHWTFGQYRLCRVLFGLALAAALARAAWSPIGAVAILAAAAFAAGFHDRAAACVLLAAGAALLLLGIVSAHLAILAAAWLLLAHCFVPPKPAGPGSGWFLPLPVAHANQAAAVAGFLVLPFSRGRGAVAAALTALLLFAFDPGWIRRRGSSKRRPETLFYDGTCGLCHGAVRFLLAEDADGSGFRFATLQGDRFTAAIGAPVRAALPDSLVLLTRHGRVLTRSRAVRHALMNLGGTWKVIGTLSGAVPRPVLDALYDLVARTRHALFARPTAACPVVPRKLRDRFID